MTRKEADRLAEGDRVKSRKLTGTVVGTTANCVSIQWDGRETLEIYTPDDMRYISRERRRRYHGSLIWPRRISEGAVKAQPSEERFKLGNYGVGTLWGIRRYSILLMLFNDTIIARRSQNSTRSKWMTLDPSWQVRSLDGAEIWVELVRRQHS